jgi:CubicO group peptidase (beta-lactamase class C family)
MSYEEFVQNRLVDPLEMNNTFAGSSMMKDKSNLAIPHSSESGTIKQLMPLTFK